MASEWVDGGSVGSDADGHVGVLREVVTGDVSVVCSRPEVRMSPAAATDLSELLDRAAMPGQPPAARHPLYGCCPHCEHCGKCQAAGDCEHGYAQPPHLRPCAFADCEPGHKAIGEAVVTGALTVAAVDPGRADQIAGNITSYAETAQEARDA